MSMASRPPAPPRQTSWYITDHAVDRLRDRLAAPVHLDNMALRSVLGTAVDRAVAAPNKVHQVKDEAGADAQLILLDEDSLDGLTLSGAAYALVKPNDREDSNQEQAIVTILPAGSNIVRRMICSQISREAAEETLPPKRKSLSQPLIADPESLIAVVEEAQQALKKAPKLESEPESRSDLLWPFPEDTAAVLVLRNGDKQHVTCYPEGFDLLESFLTDMIQAAADLGPDLNVTFFERRTLRLAVGD